MCYVSSSDNVIPSLREFCPTTELSIDSDMGVAPYVGELQYLHHSFPSHKRRQK
jgi:hypothetical protein